jgi:SpoVK/Ycf46/Vps4 family AAA+-type ATPase
MIPLPPKIDASVTMMQVEEKPDVTYSDVGGCKEQIEKLREVVETPLLNVRIYFLLLKHAHIVDSLRNSSNLESTPPKASYYTVPQVQARHYVHAR